MTDRSKKPMAQNCRKVRPETWALDHGNGSGRANCFSLQLFSLERMVEEANIGHF